MSRSPQTMPRKARASALELRKTPRQDRAEQTVAVLVEAAAQVLESDGLEGFNTNAVARRAGVSIGSLYQYFPGKDALTLALMERENATFYDEGVLALGQPNGTQALRMFIDAAVRQQLARPRLARLIDVEEGRPEFDRAMKQTRSLVQLLVKVLKSADLPPQRRPRIAAQDVGSIIRGLTDAAGARGETDTADLRKRITAAVFGYLESMGTDVPRQNASTVAQKVRRPA